MWAPKPQKPIQESLIYRFPGFRPGALARTSLAAKDHHAVFFKIVGFYPSGHQRDLFGGLCIALEKRRDA